MAALDLIAPDGYDEETLGPILIRTAAIEPPSHPLGAGYSEPYWGIYGCAHGLERGWIGIFASPEPDRALETLDEEALERIERLSILIGCSWAAISGSAVAVREAQESAVKRLPAPIYAAPPEQLRDLRALISAPDPNEVAILVAMTYHWAFDPGGTIGGY